MSIKLNFFILTLLLPVFAMAQSQELNPCGTTAGCSEWLKNYQKNKQDFDSRGNERLNIAMTVHILSNDDGKLTYSFGNFLDDFYILNKDFEQANMHFYLKSPVNYIKNTKWNNHKNYEEGQDIYGSNIENTVNSYYTTNAAGNCGYDYPGTGIVLAKSCMGKYNHTWAHEMGHELSLPHTFSGWEGENYNINAGAPFEVNGHGVELLDKSNCKDAGDGFCDTQADYLSYRWQCADDRKTSYELKDPNGQKFKVNGELFLSYSNDACTSKFSTEQIEAMRAHTLSEKIEFVSVQDPYQPLGGSAKIVFPSDSAININAEKMNFKWSKVANASHYYLEISRLTSLSSADYALILTDTFFQTNLQLGRRYYWRVRPFNQGYSTLSTNTKKHFFTTAAPSSLNETLVLNEFMVFPNPLSESQIVTVKFESDFAEKAQFLIKNINGQNLFSEKYTIETGENRLELPLNQLPKGIYFLEIKTKRGIKTEKIII